MTVTRVEKYDRQGLVWMRRVPHCIDTHGLIVAGDQLALCSTGTNQVILLDGDGAEVRRWSPDESAELAAAIDREPGTGRRRWWAAVGAEPEAGS